MPAEVIVIGPRESRPSKSMTVINTTSRSNDFGRGLSPFFLGPVKMFNGELAQNVENAWQYSKVYSEHLDEDGEPSENWWEWARAGWSKQRADRYPMGKGAVPEFSYWNWEKLTYTEARIKIYIPLYARAVRKTEAFRELRELYRKKDRLYLWDFDGYDHKSEGLNLMEVPFHADRKMGHAFVLAMMLQFGSNFYRK